MNRYSLIPVLRDTSGNRYYKTTLYPEIPLSSRDIYVYTSIGDRFDTLAQSYYKDSSLWWVISIANPQLPQGTLNPPAGAQLRIPANISNILAAYNTLNEII